VDYGSGDDFYDDEVTSGPIEDDGYDVVDDDPSPYDGTYSEE
jgi:hypothetical protein